MEKKSVLQEHEFGCGIACVAFLTNKTYQEILLLIDPDSSKATNVGYFCKDLVRVLNNLGYCYVYKYVKKHLKDKVYTDGTIVFIKRSPRYPSGHYIVRYNNKWMDPWINFIKNKHIKNAKSGFRNKLPGTPIYALFNQQ